MSVTEDVEPAAAAEPSLPVLEAPAVGPDSSAGDVIRAALAASTARLVHHDTAVRRGGDPEAIHQARVATRRLRSDLRTYRDVVDPGWGEGLREELRWIAGALGELRDTEVLGARLLKRAQRLPAPDVLAAEKLLVRLTKRGEEAREELLRAMRTKRYERLCDRLVEGARDPAVREPAARPATEVLPGIMARPWRALRRDVGRLGPEPSDEALHRVRIRAKRARYAAETMLGVYGKGARRFAAAAAALQEVLGEHHDAVVAGEWLRAVASTPRSAFVAGELAALEHEAAVRARAAWPEMWKALSRKRLRFWT